jgi:hypothetical protein
MFELWCYKLFMGVLISPPSADCDTGIPDDSTLPEYFRLDDDRITEEGCGVCSSEIDDFAETCD